MAIMSTLVAVNGTIDSTFNRLDVLCFRPPTGCTGA